MYNVYVKRIFVITEFVHMNEKTGTGVNYMKEKVKESQSRSVTPSPNTPSGAGLGASHKGTYQRQNMRKNSAILASTHLTESVLTEALRCRQFEDGLNESKKRYMAPATILQQVNFLSIGSSGNER